MLISFDDAYDSSTRNSSQLERAPSKNLEELLVKVTRYCQKFVTLLGGLESFYCPFTLIFCYFLKKCLIDRRVELIGVGIGNCNKLFLLVFRTSSTV